METVPQEVVAEEVVRLLLVELQIKDMQEGLVLAGTIPVAVAALVLWAVITLAQQMELVLLELVEMV